MSDPLLLCTDLDRTLLPNGSAAESPGARPLFKHLVAHPDITLVYVTGRHKALVQQAIDEYALPWPAYVIGDVGTTIYRLEQRQWQQWQAWDDYIGEDWPGHDATTLGILLSGIGALEPQQASRQNTYKLSYHAALTVDRQALDARLRQRLALDLIKANLVWSIDDQTQCTLLDIVPARANKLQAIEFLRQQLSLSPQQLVFSGDSGNDLTVLASHLPGILVANSTADIQREALAAAAATEQEAQLYIAKGDCLGLNGNYSAGIIEGVLHYHPRFRDWLQSAAADATVQGEGQSDGQQRA